jgi:ubiquinone/menaquinone biosynthesis C-methylase UbiE
VGFGSWRFKSSHPHWISFLQMPASRLHRKVLRKVAHALLAAAGDGRRALPARESRTVAQGWEAYARRMAREGAQVGDEWNDPAQMGLDLEKGEDVIAYLDRTVIEPFFDPCDLMIEIGAGGGRFTEVLLPKCKRLIAVDTSPTMLAQLRERFGGDSRLECQLLDGRGLGQIADDSADAAFSYGVFVHLQHWDIYRYLEELHRVLRPGGKALIQHSNVLSDLGWAKFTAEVSPQLNTHKLPYTFSVNTPQLMRELITRAGLECIEMNTEVARRDCIAFIRKSDGVVSASV